MKVLFVSPECWPFVKTGGLGDAVFSLVSSLRQQDQEIEVVLPEYGEITYYFRKRMEKTAELKVPVGWRKVTAEVKKFSYQEINFYFISNRHYFERRNLYGHEDDAERFSFFCRAILEWILSRDEIPDIIHCHDWPTALVSIFLKTHYKSNSSLSKVKTVFNIHNLKFQGLFSARVLKDVLGLQERDASWTNLEYFGDINFLKGGLVYSDLIALTSPSLVQKVQTDKYAGVLAPLFREKKDHLCGVVNGVSPEIFNPARDPYLFVNYERSPQSLNKKRENKLYFQKFFKLPVSKEIPLLVIISNLLPHKGFDLVLEVLPELLKENLQLIVLGEGRDEYEQGFKTAAWNNPNKMSVHITFNPNLARKLYGAGDFFLQPNRREPCGTSPLIAMRYLTIPLIRRTGGLSEQIIDYSQNSNQGTGFVFEKYESSQFLKTVRRALAAYARGEEEKIIANLEKQDYTWQNSAEKYIKAYQELVQ